jgi:hypothetical protein
LQKPLIHKITHSQSLGTCDETGKTLACRDFPSNSSYITVNKTNNDTHDSYSPFYNPSAHKTQQSSNNEASKHVLSRNMANVETNLTKKPDISTHPAGADYGQQGSGRHCTGGDITQPLADPRF